jgi:multiple RNA-binding domain-containing protein 1
VLVQFLEPAAAAQAYHNLDGEPFQGRLLHILPAAGKRENKLDDFALAKLPLKKQREIKKKTEASSMTFNWNSLFMNQDAVNTAIAERLGVSKHELLDPTSADAGVRQALAETTIIREAKTYFAKNGVDLNAFKKRERGDTAILVKNFPYGMTLVRRVWPSTSSLNASNWHYCYRRACAAGPDKGGFRRPSLSSYQGLCFVSGESTKRSVH